MASTRLKKVLATSAAAAALGGGAPPALAADDATARSDTQGAAVTATPAADRQRRAEAAWMGEQLRAERALRR